MVTCGIVGTGVIGAEVSITASVGVAVMGALVFTSGAEGTGVSGAEDTGT